MSVTRDPEQAVLSVHACRTPSLEHRAREAGKSTGCARARGASYKTKGNVVLMGRLGNIVPVICAKIPNPKLPVQAGEVSSCQVWDRKAGPFGTQACIHAFSTISERH